MVVILCGTQRTGKSTTARKLADKLKKQGNVKILVKLRLLSKIILRGGERKSTS
jgi:signal recognition particle GTPase